MTKNYNDPGGIQTYNLRNGYKNTKLGVIPVDWKIKTLGEIGIFSKGKGINKSELREQGLPCVRYAEIYTKYDNYTVTFTSFIDDEEANNSKEIQRGDLLFAGSGETLEDIGKCIAYLGKKPAYAGGDVIILRPEGQDPKFLGFMLNHNTANRQTHKLGQGHSVVHIYSSGLKHLKIPLPGLLEQKKIAQILSTWDVAIEKQEQLIAVKDTFKKGLMQVLLSGKKRFNGYIENWKNIPLGKLITPISGNSPSSFELLESGKHPYIKVEDLNNCQKYLTSSRFYIEYSQTNVEIGAIIFPKRGAAILNNKVRISSVELAMDSNLMAIMPNNKQIDSDFLYYKIISEKLYKIADTSTIPQINNKHILPYKIEIPSIEEQQKIASVLNKADNEIDLLKQQLVDLHDQKRGLMQQLLTGEVRVIIKK